MVARRTLMADSRCWRCNRKLLESEDGSGTIRIVCPRCGAQNNVTLDKRISGSID